MASSLDNEGAHAAISSLFPWMHENNDYTLADFLYARPDDSGDALQALGGSTEFPHIRY